MRDGRKGGDLRGARLIEGAFSALFVVASSGWGFTGGLGLEIGLERRHFEMSGRITTERKLGADSGRVYGIDALARVPLGEFSVGVGASWFGYDSIWHKEVTAPIVSVDYQPDWGRLGLVYVGATDQSSAAVSVRIRSLIAGRTYLCSSLTRDIGGDGFGGTIGVQFRW